MIPNLMPIARVLITRGNSTVVEYMYINADSAGATTRGGRFDQRNILVCSFRHSGKNLVLVFPCTPIFLDILVSVYAYT